MRVVDVPLFVDKMPSVAAARKEEEQAAGVPSASPVKLWFFDPLSLFKRLLSSDISKHMHFGMAQLLVSPGIRTERGSPRRRG
jgi:hypothetical protein